MTTLLKNRYRILKKLGSGGFGETFLAEDIDLPSRRRCVIKQLKPITNDPQVYQLVKERFEREAVILEKLGEKNSHIPSLYAYFEENEQFYLAQEWIDGITLTEKVQQTILPEETVKNILMQCLATVIAVHNQGIIHRDIKPDNIILRNSNNQPVLIDFGAVKETMGTGMTSSGHKTSSIVIGTPDFMSFEQSNGRPIFSSDLYSLALTAIYLLTGKTPMEMEADLITGVIRWRQYVPNISCQFAAILDKAIQYYPRDRFLTAPEMLNALQPLANNVSTSVQPTKIASTLVISQTSRLRDWQKALVIGIAIGVFTLVGLVLIAILLKQPPHTITTTATSPSETSQPQTSSTAKEHQSPPVPSPEISFLSKFSKLENYLAHQDWRQADLETLSLLFQSQSIVEFPCSELLQIEKLWSKYSHEHFGLTAQKEIYFETGNRPKVTDKITWSLFADRVGWRINGAWLENYNALNLTLNAPKGHLPAFAGQPGSVNRNAIDRAISCGL